MPVCPLQGVPPLVHEPPRLVRLFPRREHLRPLDAREFAGLRIPGDEARDEETGAEVEEERGPSHARFTLIRLWAPQVRISVMAGSPTPLDTNAGGLAACCRVRPPDDLPLAGFVGEPVADLKLHR
jgi:hypothetical protein